jgi:uncharacterized LabA/DUF88 family protein
MDRVAIFVDAGYLFAQGSALLAGQKQPRKLVRLDEKAAIGELLTVANKAATGVPLLRVYWYDGGLRWPSTEQQVLADMDHVKLRLGFLNSAGQQKGVDSLIVTDLIELARNHAISDAVLLSGDEDIRVGVQVAQTLGVRVHLVGIEPGRGSQSRNLRQESDTIHEMNKACVSKFLKVLPKQATLPVPVAAAVPAAAVVIVGQMAAQGGQQVAAAAAAVVVAPAVAATLTTVAAQLLALLTDDDIKKLSGVIGKSPGMPSDLDGKLLAKAGTALHRQLDLAERRSIRAEFRQMYDARLEVLLMR